MAPRDPTVESFLLLLAAQRSPRTVDAYRRDLAALAAFRSGPVDGASVEEIERWLAQMRADGLAPSTLARRVSAVRAFFRNPLPYPSQPCAERGAVRVAVRWWH